jgi:hypothetical protein
LVNTQPSGSDISVGSVVGVGVAVGASVAVAVGVPVEVGASVAVAVEVLVGEGSFVAASVGGLTDGSAGLFGETATDVAGILDTEVSGEARSCSVDKAAGLAEGGVRVGPETTTVVSAGDATAREIGVGVSVGKGVGVRVGKRVRMAI